MWLTISTVIYLASVFYYRHEMIKAEYKQRADGKAYDDAPISILVMNFVPILNTIIALFLLSQADHLQKLANKFYKL